MMKWYLFLIVLVTGVWGREETPLDEYVWRYDETTSWELIEVQRGLNSTYYTLQLNSQTWFTEAVSSQALWQHHLLITVPDNVEDFEHAAMWIDGGHNTDRPPPALGEHFIVSELMALPLKSVITILRQIPNQPIKFWDDPEQKSRYEDSLLAWTWEEVRLGRKPADFLLRAPMTKAVIEAMNAVGNFTKDIDSRFNIDKYYLIGASKRGWTAWTAAAVDDVRVVGFSPMVISCLDFVSNINHHYQAMGGYSFALESYEELNLTCYLNDPSSDIIFDVVDPIVYVDRYTMPKYVVMATGDEFFLPDDTIFFWEQLPEPKYLNVLPNANHILLTGVVILYRAQRAFWYALMTNSTLPKLTWTKEYTKTGGRLTVVTDTPPVDVRIWSARTIDTRRRDFRWAKISENGTSSDDIEFQPVFWSSSDPVVIEDGVSYQAEFESPPAGEGWLGFFLQLRYPGPKDGSFWEYTFTTEVMIVPNILPFPPCEGAGCCGPLV